MRYCLFWKPRCCCCWKPADADENEEVPHLCDPEKPKPPALAPFALELFNVTCRSSERLFE